ncbi:UDP-N-acetylmuramoyl-L-alanyl-D-glutamate--2,6-diaminopimelate ligase [Haloimpatiens massiliensis]|uniref:UDP-N-acetylmuramoyl-L-alanyl-D-glutamate--2, 6-diaminopimelate ligase n=1 Tax=Haloimpatiens massiliensis TaxID=1658110 RepID=UPI000C85009E|nr:UDP-N-acetylmuramoyl-L-alanyl-D-glutamate--2,6-diaminopimelate ligase [Haloimpatiens massiliensis]
MKIKELLINIPYTIMRGSDEIDIHSISWDSRRVKSNALFVCVKNRNVDRHDHASAAVNAGAIALVVEHEVQDIPENITIIKVQNTKVIVASIANTYYNEPSKKFNLIGVTGTNGKTSVSIFISKILEGLGRKVGVIGTIENRIGNKTLKTQKKNPTTPDAIELQESFNEMIELDVKDVVMEVSSSALDNYRVYKCDFDMGIFTNLTQDHLEEHGTMENYKNAKMKLFKMCRLGIINSDDKVSKEIKHNAKCDIITYGIHTSCDFKARDICYSLEGVNFILDFHGVLKKVSFKIPGKFSVYNALAAIAACYFLGIPLDIIIEEISNITGVAGRFQVVPNNKDYLTIVDYAHTPDALKNVLSTARELTKNRIILVFGCGGNRDKTKRPIMGEMGGEFADMCFITSDNPRNENPTGIINDIEVGIKKTNCIYEKIQDRKEAIYAALKAAKTGDIVIIAGKGHENYQIVGEKLIHFDDAEIVRSFK